MFVECKQVRFSQMSRFHESFGYTYPKKKKKTMVGVLVKLDRK